MTTRSSALVELSEITDPRYGGKAHGLAELVGRGFAVPAAFVIADADQGLPDGLEARWAALSGDGAKQVAVRSSATGEDGAESSFAGQYESVLGVADLPGLLAAIDHCVASATSERAAAYQTASGTTAGGMHLVVQEMVDARAAGVVFSADPLSGRRDLAVVDAVAGLGEALVDGSTTSDHLEIDDAGTIVLRECAGEPVLSDEEVLAVAAGARRAAALWQAPLDLEWAIDPAGEIRWLQARPITTLPGDLNAMDSNLAGADHVYTRCNIGEMMPGAYAPLTASVTGKAIEYAMQCVQVTAGLQEAYEEDRWLQVGYFYGHMFLNMTEGTALSSGILGNSLEQYSLSIAGRIVDELVPLPPLPTPKRLVNTVKLTTFALSAGRAIRRVDKDLAVFVPPSASDPALLLAEIDRAVDLYFEVTLAHVRSSARAAVPANVLEETVLKEALKAGRSEDDARAEASALLTGAADVESAMMLAQLDAVVGLLADHAETAAHFASVDPAEAVIWFIGLGGPASTAFATFLEQHGHRGYRELDMRDRSWADDPAGLGAIVQAMLRARLAGASEQRAARPADREASRAVRFIARLARAGASGRESTKSRMALMAFRLKRAYLLLGETLEASGRLPDADLVFFFDRSELRVLVGSGDASALVAEALVRRTALPFQAKLEFPDVAVGRPAPFRPPAPEVSDGLIVGRPACSGVAEGLVRVATTIAEAQHLQPGEILVAPVTDVGWTPYFTLIAALVTDIGSSVSHGAVVAREYGLPCVVNTLGASRVLKTGDRVRVDGDRGTVQILTTEKESADV
ncbi:MAG: Phosphoenolpyruvate synthase / pyruvate phosphate dikinase [Marmoricola sp.]|nr:Phosphoenolpyruvate synthase / pyruvate phosphate dikinase [Marmoricola sp.]